tara:strand:+ start:51 stop:275 length:225 start_codon:yes stop_codon:yes gene_type:complete
MGATKEMLITEFEYKNDEALYTMFQVNNELLAIEREGYDVSQMDFDDSEVTIVSEMTAKSTDVEGFIHEYFISK